MKKNTGKLIALSAAGLFLAGTSLIAASPARASDESFCQVKNSCKAKGACGVKGKHDCGGKNACKGQGWVKLKISKEDCEKVLDATWVEKKAEK